MKKHPIPLAILVFALTISTAVLAKSPSFETIDFPGAWYTFLRGINNRGQIVGYASGPDVWGSFLFDGDTFTAIEFPGAQYTEVYRGINDRGQIVGSYYDDTGSHGFLLDGDTFITIDLPGALATYADGINDRGQIVGEYSDNEGYFHGFVADKVRMAPPASAPYSKVTTTWAGIKAR